MALTRAWPRSSLRPRTATFAPASPKPSANAPPSAPVAPITTATSPDISNRFISAALWDKVHGGRRSFLFQALTRGSDKGRRMPRGRWSVENIRRAASNRACILAFFVLRLSLGRMTKKAGLLDLIQGCGTDKRPPGWARRPCRGGHANRGLRPSFCSAYFMRSAWLRVRCGSGLRGPKDNVANASWMVVLISKIPCANNPTFVLGGFSGNERVQRPPGYPLALRPSFEKEMRFLFSEAK